MSSQKSLGYNQTVGVAAATGILGLAAGGVLPTGTNGLGPDFAIIQCVNKDCIWRDDGTAPTASVGNYLTAGDTIIVRSSQFAKWQIIQVAATATVNITFYQTG